MNSKSTFIVVLICGLLLSGVLTRNGEILLLVLPFLVYLIIGILGCPDQMDIRARRVIERAQAVPQQPVKIEVIVENQGRALSNLYLSDPVLPGLEIADGAAQQRVALSGRGTLQLQYAARGMRGHYSWSTVRASASDPCRLFELRRELRCPGELRVQPGPMKLRRVAIRPRSTLHAPGPTPARLAGPGTDFWGVREYRVGDPLRRLNWRLAGRYPRRLFTNEFEGEEIADFGLILDARRLTNAFEVEQALFESSLSAAAALSEAFLKNGNRVALLIFGETPASLFPGYGKRQLNRILRELARAKLGRNLSARYLEYFPTRVFPSRSVILVFSALDSDDLETYRRLRSFGYEVLLISPDPVEYASRGLPPTATNGLAVRAARLERIVQLKELLKMGVGVIDWQVSQPLDMLLRNVARDQAHRRNL